MNPIFCTLSNSNAFSSTPYAGYSASFSGMPCIYVPSFLLSSYQTATNWAYFSSYFSAVDVDYNIITFTIDNTKYQAFEGMTWEEWVGSSFNTEWFNVYYNYITNNYYTYVCNEDLTYVDPSDIILANTAYTSRY